MLHAIEHRANTDVAEFLKQEQLHFMNENIGHCIAVTCSVS